MTHVEMYNGRPWCESSYVDPTKAMLGPEYIPQERWHESPTELMGADCRECLGVIYTLGQWARNVKSQLPKE